ncbi:MAG TPA: tetratricopeptide repeat protein [Pyrinomonadaceae bacterium]|jgi:tetratricopeptide (TPR) repeat protein
METIWENLKSFFRLYVKPSRAFGSLMDNGSWIFAAVALLIVSFAFQTGVNNRLNEIYGAPPFDFETYRPQNVAPISPNDEDAYYAEYQAAYENYQRALRERQKLPLIGNLGLWLFNFNSGNFLSLLLALAVFYIPATILLLTLFEPLGSFGLVFRRDYGVFSTCVFAAWTAAHLPFAVAGLILKNQAANPNILLALWLAGGLYFGVLMIFALRTVFGASYKSAIAVVSLSWLSISFGNRVLGFISPFLFSPLLLVFVFLLLRGEASAFGDAFRQRRNFRRFLQNATVNPRDADAHVQLGILYKQRRQFDEAVRHFEKAIEIEPQEIEANYELGKIARESGELERALRHFSIVAEQDEKHALNEIWREIGATYFDAGAFAEAREFLGKFVERRPFDPEGLFRLGQTLKALNLNEEAREMFRRCVEAVQTSPDYRRGLQRKWGKLAEKQLAV